MTKKLRWHEGVMALMPQKNRIRFIEFMDEQDVYCRGCVDIISVNTNKMHIGVILFYKYNMKKGTWEDSIQHQLYIEFEESSIDFERYSDRSILVTSQSMEVCVILPPIRIHPS